jgi:hypothetical protein
MNSSGKPATRPEPLPYPIAGPAVGPRLLPPARGDLSDWIDLMEVVEALCPRWPERPAPAGKGQRDYRL